jgi:hypothetical protein
LFDDRFLDFAQALLAEEHLVADKERGRSAASSLVLLRAGD